MNMRLTVLLAIVTLAIGNVSAQNGKAPPPITPGEKPIDGSTEAELWYGMNQSEKELRHSPLVVHDPELNAYIRKVACKIVDEYCSDLRIYVLDIPAFNASMAPNGVMIFFTGALLRIQDESELALILGHEFGHYRARHSLQLWNKAKRGSALMATVGLVTYGAGVGIAGSVAQLIGVGVLSKFSRDMEREADNLGFRISNSLKYDANAGARIWQRMRNEELASEQRRPFPVFASHPRTTERLATMVEAGKTNAASDQQKFQEPYREVMKPHIRAWLDEELSKRTFKATIQVITDLIKANPDHLSGLYIFYLGEAHRQRRAEGDLEKSAELFEQAITLPDCPPEAWRELGTVYRNRGDNQAAIDAFSTYLDRYEQAPDAAFIQRKIEQMRSEL